MLVVQVLQNPTASVERKYFQTVNTVPVAEAATMPTYDQMKSSTFRYGVLRAWLLLPHYTEFSQMHEHDYGKFGYCHTNSVCLSVRSSVRLYVTHVNPDVGL